MNRAMSFIMALFSSTMIMSGCDYANVETEAMNVKRLESTINEKLDGDIDPKNDIKIIDLNGDGNVEYVVRYKVKDKENPLRIMILTEENGKPVMKAEIENVGEEFDEVEYIDINDNGSIEIVAGYKVGKSSSKGLSIYEYNDGNTEEIFQEYYSRYKLKKSKHDSKADILIIKEKEKGEKSFAYLYKWEENQFENIKKVEIDPTLNTEDEIFDTLLEKDSYSVSSIHSR